MRRALALVAALGLATAGLVWTGAVAERPSRPTPATTLAPTTSIDTTPTTQPPLTVEPAPQPEPAPVAPSPSAAPPPITPAPPTTAVEPVLCGGMPDPAHHRPCPPGHPEPPTPTEPEPARSPGGCDRALVGVRAVGLPPGWGFACSADAAQGHAGLAYWEPGGSSYIAIDPRTGNYAGVGGHEACHAQEFEAYGETSEPSADACTARAGYPNPYAGTGRARDYFVWPEEPS